MMTRLCPRQSHSKRLNLEGGPLSARTVLALLLFCLSPVTVVAQGNNSATAHGEKGLQLAQAGDLASAEAELRQAVELAPDNATYLAGLGTVLAMQKKLEASTAVLAKAVKLNPDDLVARRNLAAGLWQLGRFEEARQNLQILLRATPGDQSSVLLLGMVSENLKDFRTAAKLLSSVPGLVKQQPESIAALVASYYRTGERQKARATLQELAKPAGPKAIFLGAGIAAQAGDYDTAEKLYEEIVPTYPDPAAVGYNLAQVEYQAHRYSESQKTLLDLIAAGHETSDMDNLLGWCYQKQNEPQRAIHSFEQAIERNPVKESNYLDLGAVLYDDQLFEAALVLAKQDVAALPNSYRAYLLKGLVELKLSHFTDAIASYSRAAQLNPSEPQASLGVAKAEWAGGMTQAAATAFEDGIRRFPQDPQYHLEYALMLLRLAQAGNDTAKTQAEAQLKMALAFDSRLSEAYYQLGSLELEKGQSTDALKYLQAADKLDPEASKTHFALARAYRRLKRRQDAVKEMALYQKLKDKEERRSPVLSPAGMGHD